MAIAVSYELDVTISGYEDYKTDYIKRVFIKDYNHHKTLYTLGIEHSTIEEDLLKFSQEYPEHLFKLYGNEVDNELLWIKYFKNGLVQYEKAIITYPEFDESKLK